MSGLIGFFKDFLPNVTNIDHDRRWEDLTVGETGDEGVIQHDNDDNSDPLVTALSRPPVNPQVDYVPAMLSFEEWRKFSRKSLQEFYGRRLITPSQEDDSTGDDGSEMESNDDDWNSSSENDHNHHHRREEEGDVEEDDETGGNELALASQPTFPDPNQNAEPITTKKPRKRRVPPLYQAIHSILTLQYLDLRTKDLSLELCKVTKIWKLRETKRGYKYMAYGNLRNEQQPCCLFPGRMPRAMFGNLDDDGPMSPAYKYVLSLELEQVFPISDLQQTTSTTLAQRKYVIRLFLYDGYAKVVSEWMGKQSKPIQSNRTTTSTAASNNHGDTNSTGYILSLFKVPALSIFPHALDPRDWWDQEHVVPYCICLGDSSNMVATPANGNPTIQIRADSDEVELRLAKASSMSSNTIRESSRSLSELILSKRMLSQPANQGQWEDQELAPPSRLRTRWKEYCQATKQSASSQQGVTSPIPRPLPPALQEQQQQQQQHEPIVVRIETQTPNPTNVASPSNQPLPGNVSDPYPPVPACASPPLPTKRPIEPMIFDGEALKRPRLQDVTNHIDAPPSVEYAPLASLRSLYNEYQLQNPNIHQYRTINTYGVVLGFTVPCQTKRGDWMVSATLVDESCTVPVTLIIFTTHESKLPQFQQTGDVIRIQKVALQLWREEVQLSGRKTSSYVIIRRSTLQPTTTIGTSTTPTIPAPTPTPTINHASPQAQWLVLPAGSTDYTFEASDEERSQTLWYWGQQLLQDHSMIIHPAHKFTLGEMVDMKDEEYGDVHDRDLIVLVTGIIPYPTDQVNAITAYGFLRVWDGTGSTNDPLPIYSEEADRIRKLEGDPPGHVVSKVAQIIQSYRDGGATTHNNRDDAEDEQRPMDEDGNGDIQDLEIPGALCGKVANVVIWERAHWHLIYNHIPVGTFIRMRNVGVRKWQDQTFHSLMVHSKSWLSPLPTNTFEIRSLLEQHNIRLKRKEYNTESGLRPLSRCDDPGPTTIPNHRSIIGSIPSGTGLAEYLEISLELPTQHGRRLPYKTKDGKSDRFCGIVRLVEPTFPEFKGDLSVFCYNRNGRNFYRCGMTVTDDSSASLEVIVPHHLAERIFGVPAQVAAKGIQYRETPFDSNVARRVSIYGTVKEGRRFFVMTDISLMTET